MDLSNAITSAAKEIGKEGKAGMGAIEYLAVQIREGLEEVARSNREIAESLKEREQ